MKLLVLTQKVDRNDPVLGFFHDWLVEFAKRVEGVVIICLAKGKYELPSNCRVLSLGKEEGVSKIRYIYRFFKYIIQERKNYDAVFVHMNPEYVVLAGWFWKLLGKKVILWYTHKSVTWKLKAANFFVDKIFTASREGLQISSSKVEVVGHGINTERFAVKEESGGESRQIIYVGRISHIKNQELLIRAADILINQKKQAGWRINFVGAPQYLKDVDYLRNLERIVKDCRLENYVKFIGAVSYQKIAGYYRGTDLSINLCPTGGMDKAVLESVACGIPTLVYNKAFLQLFGGLSKFFILDSLSAVGLADKIVAVSNWLPVERGKALKELRERIIKFHDLKKLVSRIIASAV